MSDTVRFGADATEYFDVVQQMQNAHARLSNTFNDTAIGDGFLRSEQRVAHSAGAIASSLIQANSAADVLAASLIGLERSTFLGIGVAVGAVVIAEAFIKVQQELEKTKKAEEALRLDFNKPLSLEVNLGTAELTKEIDDLKTKTDSLAERAASVTHYIAQSLKVLALGGEDPNKTISRQIDEQTPAEDKRLELIKALGAAELKVADAKELSAHHSALEGELAKNQIAYEEKIAALRLGAIKDPFLYKALPDQLEADKKELDINNEIAEKKAFIAGVDLESADKVASFRGTTEEKERLILDQALQNAQTQKNIQDVIGNQTEQKQAQLAVAKALEAIDQHRLALAIQQSQLHFSQEENKVREDTSRQAVGAGPEQTGRLAADEAVHLAALKLASVKDEIRIEQELLQTKEISYQLIKAEGDAQATLNVAINKRAEFELKTYQARQLALAAAQGETVILADKEAHDQRAEGLAQIQLKYQQEIAKARQDQVQPAIIAELEKQAELSERIFREDFDFKRQQQLEAAKAQTTELQLQAEGQSELGRFVRDRIDAELKIVAAIREQNGALADQIRAQEEARIIAGLAADLRKTPKQQEAAQVEQQAQQDAAYRAAALIKDINDRIARGAYGQTPDAATEAAAAIRNLGESAKKEADAKPSLPDWTQLKPHLPDWSHLLPRGLPAGEPTAGDQPPIAPSSSTSVPGEQPAPPSQAPAAQQNPIVEAVKARQAEENRPRDSHFADLQEQPEPFLPKEPLPQATPPESEPKPTPGPLPPAPDWTSIKPDLPQWSDLQPKVPDWSSLKPTGATGSPGEGTSAPQQTPASAPTATPASQPEPVKPAPIDLSGLKNLFSGLDLGKPAPAPFLPSDVGPPGVAGGQKPDFSNAQNLLNSLNPEAQPQLPPPAAQPSAPPAPDWSAVKPELPEWTQLKPELPDWSKLKPSGPEAAGSPANPPTTPATTTPALSEPSASPSQRPAPSETPAPRETSPTTAPSAPPPAQPSAPPAPDWSAIKPALPDWTQLKPEVPDWTKLKPSGETSPSGESTPGSQPIGAASSPIAPPSFSGGDIFNDLSAANRNLAESVKNEVDAITGTITGLTNLGGAAGGAAGDVNKLSAPSQAAAREIDKLPGPATAAASAVDNLGKAADAAASKVGKSGESAPGGAAPPGADPFSKEFFDRHLDINGAVESAIDRATGKRVTFPTPEFDRGLGPGPGPLSPDLPSQLGALDKTFNDLNSHLAQSEKDFQKQFQPSPDFEKQFQRHDATPTPSGPFSNDQGVGDQPPSKSPASSPAEKPQVPDWTDQKPKGLPDWTSEKPKGLPDWTNEKPTLPDWSTLKPTGLPDFSKLNFSSLIGLASANFSSLIAIGQMNFSGLSSLNGLTITIQ